MLNSLIEDQRFEGTDYSVVAPQTGTYENCIFKNCNFAGTNLGGNTFSECQFENCDFSNAIIKNASFRDVMFINCKQIGLRFDECNKMLLSFSFDHCVLNFCSFYKMKLKGTKFKDCELKEADFTEADLTNVNFQNCDFTRAMFDNTILEGSDFRTAYNFIIDPERNRMKKAKFSAAGVTGLLHKYNIVID